MIARVVSGDTPNNRKDDDQNDNDDSVKENGERT